MDSAPLKIPLPPAVLIPRLWLAYRRPTFLIILVTGLAVYLVWLPVGARAALLSALSAQRALVGLLLLFSIIVLSLVWSAGQHMDTWIFMRLNLHGFRPIWLDRAMILVTQMGNMLTAMFLAGLFFLFHVQALAAEVVIGTLVLWLFIETIKTLTDRARPFLAIEGTRIIGWKEQGRSFPSGHTAQTFFLVTVIIHQFHLGMDTAILLYAIAVLVGFTRIYVGAHYPRDVIGGAVLGSIWGVLAALLDPYWLGIRF